MFVLFFHHACSFISLPYFLSIFFSLLVVTPGEDTCWLCNVITWYRKRPHVAWAPWLIDAGSEFKIKPARSCLLYFYCGCWDVCTAPAPTSHKESVPTEFRWYRNHMWWEANSTKKGKYSSMLIILVKFISNVQRQPLTMLFQHRHERVELHGCKQNPFRYGM
jgi:hypothetical protein